MRYAGPGSYLEFDRRRELLRTNLWFVPTLEVLAAVGLFVLTYALDRAVYRGALAVPSWIIGGTPDAARQVLTAIAAAIITVVGVVFSITIVALTLASTQFGPRMLRNFMRDRGTQFTVGTFVASFVYAIAHWCRSARISFRTSRRNSGHPGVQAGPSGRRTRPTPRSASP